MKGLIIKDFMAVRTALPTLSVMLLLPLLIVIPMAAISGGLAVQTLCVCLTALLCIINSVVGMSFGSYDEQCGWNTFGCALPVSRTQTVLARYGAGLLLLGASLGILLTMQILCFIFTGEQIVWYYPAVLIILTLLTEGIMTPVIYLFGAQIGGYIFAALFMLAGIGGTALGRSRTMEMSDEAFDAMIENGLQTHLFAKAAALTVLGSMILYVLSVPLSIHIFKKKEF